MSDTKPVTELSTWISTYGVLTAQRILERFNLSLSQTDLLAAVHHTHSVYYQLLRVPIKNLLNGIVLQQASDYQIYAQKLFVDYMLSGEPDKSAESPGANTRQEIDTLRTNLVAKAEAFNLLEIKHQKLIASSQKALIKLTDELRPKLKSADIEDSFGIEQQLGDFIDEADSINDDLCVFRTEFYQSILDVTELLNMLGDYRIDPISDAINRETLYFDSSIGR